MSQKLNGRNVKWFPEGESLATIITESVEVSTYGITPKSCPSEIISGGFGYGTLITAGGRGNQGYGYGFAIYAGTNTAGTRVFATYDKDGGWSERVSKSDLPKYDIKTFTVDVTTQNANSNGKYYTDKKLSTESWYSSAKAIVPLFARKSGGAYICTVEIEYETLRVQADIAISGVTVGILVVS